MWQDIFALKGSTEIIAIIPQDIIPINMVIFPMDIIPISGGKIINSWKATLFKEGKINIKISNITT